MALGKPPIITPRSFDLRQLQELALSVRERLGQIEAAIAALSTSTTSTSTSSTSGGSAASMVRSFNDITRGLLAKTAANTFASRQIEVPVEFDGINMDGVAGNPSFDWKIQAPSLIFASPVGYDGRPEFRALELSDIPTGPDTYFLQVVGGMAMWSHVVPGSGMANPMLDYGDLIVGESAGSPARLPIGTEGQVLTVSSGLPQWEDATGGPGGSAVGFDLFVGPLGLSLASSGAIAPSNSAHAVPLTITAGMWLDGLECSVAVGGGGTVQWGLFDYSTNPAAATLVAEGSGVMASAGAGRIAATGAPVAIAPGAYMLVISYPSSGCPQIRRVVGSSAVRPAIKYKTPYVWTTTPDFTAAGWTLDNNIMHTALVGRMSLTATW